MEFLRSDFLGNLNQLYKVPQTRKLRLITAFFHLDSVIKTQSRYSVSGEMSISSDQLTEPNNTRALIKGIKPQGEPWT